MTFIQKHFLLVLCTVLCGASRLLAQDTSLDSGWRLLLDDKAAWRDDTLYLPDEVDLSKISVNPPTGGWSALNDQAGIAVTLPSTVEEHYWGKPPADPPASSKPADIVNNEGNYLGVSWWYRNFEPPPLKPGERLMISFRGARLRSEVYVNGKLVGYNIITEAPFTADATEALKPGGGNQLAVRITNPGGNMAWIDFQIITWGKYQIPISHGFGGIDGGVKMEVRAPVQVSDLSVLNEPNLKAAKLCAAVTSSAGAYDGPVDLSVARDGKPVWSGTATVHVPAKGVATATVEATVPNAEPWDVNHPVLYQASAALPKLDHTDRSTAFGFRWFTARGVGQNAQLEMNGRRIVPITAISWGFWAPNGMFPDQAAVDREVAAVKALGIYGVQNHRHMPKPLVLDAFDRAGLLRYCEPGAGVFTFVDKWGEDIAPNDGPVDASGKGGEPPSFMGRYELAKVLAMIKTNRSHPSVTMWCLQNEVSPDLHNPRVYYTLHKMREADPSRLIVIKSGSQGPKQVWAMPYSDELLHDDGTGYSGWQDQHTANTQSGVYLDHMYKSPTDYLYHSPITKEVVMWGEMATGASPDDHTAEVNWYKATDRPGYDREAQETILNSYNQFLDEYKFRSSFPTAEALFKAAADKHYFSASHLLENARMCDANDYLVLSGWESTAVENHCALVDSIRNLKTDPAPIKEAAAPALLVIRPHQYTVAKGTSATVDVHLINTTNLQGSYQLTLTASLPNAAPFFHVDAQVNAAGGDTFGQLLKDNIAVPCAQPGMVTLSAALTPANGASPVLQRTEKFLVIDPSPAPLTGPVGTAGVAPDVGAALQKQYGLASTPLTEAQGKLKTILVANTGAQFGKWTLFKTPNAQIEGADDPELYKQQYFGNNGLLQSITGLPPGKATVELLFAETFATEPGRRTFDVEINGRRVLKEFDIFAESGGKNHAITKKFTVDVPEKGEIDISVPRAKKERATFAAMRITDANGRVLRTAFRESDFKDKEGNVWSAAHFNGFDWPGFLPAALDRVKNDGTRLVLLTSNGDDAAAAASALGKLKIVDYSGQAGDAGSAWLGFWYFGKKHWLLDGLPSDTVLSWPYQIAAGDGVFIKGADVEAVIGYGKNHSPNIGLGAAVIACGKGQIILLDLPGLAQASLTGDSAGMQPVAARRLLYNALH